MIEDEEADFEDGESDLSPALAALFGLPEQGSRKPQGLQECPFEPCPDCGGPRTQANGYFNADIKTCERCDGVGYLDVPVDQFMFNRHRPGSEVRIAMMTARESAGLGLWTGRSPFERHTEDAA